MRDAFGGVFMIRLLLVFIVIYVGFTAISMNYAKAFRFKNHLIDYVEKNEGVSLNGASVIGAGSGKLNNTIKNLTCDQTENIYKCTNGRNNITITPSEEGKYISYEISVSIPWTFSFIKVFTQTSGGEDSGIWAIKGIAKVIKK